MQIARLATPFFYSPWTSQHLNFQFPIYFNFQKILLEVVAIGRKNAGKDPDNRTKPPINMFKLLSWTVTKWKWIFAMALKKQLYCWTAAKFIVLDWGDKLTPAYRVVILARQAIMYRMAGQLFPPFGDYEFGYCKNIIRTFDFWRSVLFNIHCNSD